MRNNSGSYNLTHHVTNDLGMKIVQGLFDGEDFPTESQISERYDISRSITREAVKMLTAKGLLTSRPRQGIRLMPISNWNMFDSDVLGWTLNSKPSLSLLKEFTQLRFAIEPEAAALAAIQASDEDIRQIELSLKKLELAEKGEGDSLEADIAFHTNILNACGNRFFIQLSDFIEAALRVSITHTNNLKRVNVASHKDHESIFFPIRDRKPEQARETMRYLLNEALLLIETGLKK